MSAQAGGSVPATTPDEQPEGVDAAGTGTRRPVLVAALLLLAAAGLRMDGRQSGGTGPNGWLVADVLAAAGAALLVLAAVRAFRGLAALRAAPVGGPPARRRRAGVLRQVLTLALLGALLLTPTGSRLFSRLGAVFGGPDEAAPTAPRRPAVADRSPPAAPRSVAPAALGGAAAAGAALLLAGLLRRRRSRGAPPPDAPTVAAAFTAAAAALDDGPTEVGEDPRARVIRAYAAMERVLAAAGTARRPADTPAELLARAGGAAGLPTGPVAVLTEVFRRARYDPSPVPDGDVHRAREALGALQQPVGAPR